LVAVVLGMAACNDPPSLGGSPPLQTASSNATGSSNDPTPASTCQQSTNEGCIPCKTCVDARAVSSTTTAAAAGTGGVSPSPRTGSPGAGSKAEARPRPKAAGRAGPAA